MVDADRDSARGIGHRVVWGHSLDHLGEIHHLFGWRGVGDFFKHLAVDAMSPHGIPLPFAAEIQEAFHLKMRTTIEWLCVNAGDLASGGLSFYGSWRLWRRAIDAKANGHLSPALVASMVTQTCIKITVGLLTHNIIVVASGAADIGAIGFAVMPSAIAGETFAAIKSAASPVKLAMESGTASALSRLREASSTAVAAIGAMSAASLSWWRRSDSTNEGWMPVPDVLLRISRVSMVTITNEVFHMLDTKVFFVDTFWQLLANRFGGKLIEPVKIEALRIDAKLGIVGD